MIYFKEICGESSFWLRLFENLIKTSHKKWDVRWFHTQFQEINGQHEAYGFMNPRLRTFENRSSKIMARFPFQNFLPSLFHIYFFTYNHLSKCWVIINLYNFHSLRQNVGLLSRGFSIFFKASSELKYKIWRDEIADLPHRSPFLSFLSLSQESTSADSSCSFYFPINPLSRKFKNDRNVFLHQPTS